MKARRRDSGDEADDDVAGGEEDRAGAVFPDSSGLNPGPPKQRVLCDPEHRIPLFPPSPYPSQFAPQFLDLSAMSNLPFDPAEHLPHPFVTTGQREYLHYGCQLR